MTEPVSTLPVANTQMPTSTATLPSLPPPGAGRRDNAPATSQRTRRLAAPSASYATEPIADPVTSQPFTPPFQVPHYSAAPAPAPFSPQPVASSMTISSAPSLAPVEAEEPLFLPSPALSPSMFSPVGKGSDLFDTHPDKSSSGTIKATPTLPASTDDFLDFGDPKDGELSHFGITPRSSSSASLDTRITQAERVNKLFETTPSPSPPPISTPSGPPQRPEISKSAASLFADDDFEQDEPLAFGSAPTPITSASPAPFVTSVPTSYTPTLKPAPVLDVFAKSLSNSMTSNSDLFADDDNEDFLPATLVAAPVVASPSAAFKAPNLDIKHTQKEESVAFTSAPTLSLAETTNSVEFLTLKDEPTTPIKEPEIAPLATSPTVIADTKFSTPLTSSGPHATAMTQLSSPSPNALLLAPAATDSLFGDEDDSDLDFGTFSAPPQVPQVQKPATPVSIAQVLPTPTIPISPAVSLSFDSEASDEPLFGESSPVKVLEAPVATFTAPTTFIPSAPNLAPTVPAIEDISPPETISHFESPIVQPEAVTPVEPSSEPNFESNQFVAFQPPTAVPQPEEELFSAAPVAAVSVAVAPTAAPPVFSDPSQPPVFQPTAAGSEENAFVPPPSASSRAPARSSGPKRPRHFQYTAGQSIPVPGADMNAVVSAGPPPKTGAHPPLPTAPQATNGTIAPPWASVAPTAPFVSSPVASPVAHPFDAPQVLPPAAPTFQPLPSAPVPPFVAQSYDNGFSNPHHHEHNNGNDGDKKGSLFEPLGQLQSRGLNWFKSTLATVMAPAADTPKEDEIETRGSDGLYSPSETSSFVEPPAFLTTQPAHFMMAPAVQHEAPADAPPATLSPLAFPLPTATSGAVPLPRVGGAAKKKAARPGPFKSAVAPPVVSENQTSPAAFTPSVPFPFPPTAHAPAPSAAPVALHAVATSEEPPKRVEPVNVSAPVVPPFYEDSPFHVSSGLVSFDYTAPNGSGLHEDPFGSDENVSATDLFSKLRGVKPSLNGSVEILASPSTSQHLAKLNASASQPSEVEPAAPAAPKQETTAPVAQPPAIATAPIPVVASRELEESQAQVSSLKNQLSSANGEVTQLKEALRQVESQNGASSQLVSSLQATERDLRAQLSQMIHTHESVSESQHESMKAELEAANSRTQAVTSKLTAQNAELSTRTADLSQGTAVLLERISHTEGLLSELEKAKKALEAENEKLLARTSSSNADLEARISQLEQSLAESQRSNSTYKDQIAAKDADIASWRSKLESERASSRDLQTELDDRIASLRSNYESKSADEARAWQQKERALNIEIQQMKLSMSGSSNSEKRLTDEMARISQDNERYVALMQQQAASQTSVIDRLILQNAELVKAVEFARRVLQESKNPDSLGGIMSDNERLQEDLEAAETELASLRSRNKELDYKASHFEGESVELLRRLNSIDYRLLHQQETQEPLNGSPSAPEVTQDTHTISVADIAPFAAAISGTPINTASSSSSSLSTSIETPVVATVTSSDAQKLSAPEPTSSPVPTSPGDWQPKSPTWLAPTYTDSPGKTPSRLPPANQPQATTSIVTIAPLPSAATVEPVIPQTSQKPAPSGIPSPSPFVVTAPASQMPSASVLFDGRVNASPAPPGIHHIPLSPHINLDDMEEVSVTGDARTLPTDTPLSPQGTPSRQPRGDLKTAPQRGLMGRIWQAVTLQ